jgi:hypothetical protein
METLNYYQLTIRAVAVSLLDRDLTWMETKKRGIDDEFLNNPYSIEISPEWKQWKTIGGAIEQTLIPTR